MIQEEVYPLIDPDRLDYIDRQQQLFNEAKPRLIEEYLNQPWF